MAQIKEPDPLILIAFIAGSFFNLGISLAVGLPFLLYRKREFLGSRFKNIKNNGFPLISPREMGNKKDIVDKINSVK